MHARSAALLLALSAPAAVAAAEDLYRVQPAVDLPVIAAGLAAAGFPYLFRDLIAHRCPCDPSEVNRFDRLAIGHHSTAAEVASDVTLGLAIGLPPVVDALRLGLGRPFANDAAIYAETLAVNSALVVAAKYAARRPLPRTYEGDPAYLSSDGGYRSFYSGHVSTVVAALTAAAWTSRWRDGERGWPWAVVGVAGASVGVERVLAGRHFPTDVLVGAAAGFAVGTAVPWLHRRGDGAARGTAAVQVAPLAPGLVLSGVF